MKRYPKLVQCDARGQIVIPKEIRQDLDIDEGTGFWIYSISDEGIFLKKVDAPQLSDHKSLDELKEKSSKLNVNKKQIEAAEKNYKKTKKGRLDLI